MKESGKRVQEAGERKKEGDGPAAAAQSLVSQEGIGLASAKRGEDPRQREDGCLFTGEAERGNAIQRPDPGYSQPLESSMKIPILLMQ